MTETLYNSGAVCSAVLEKHDDDDRAAKIVGLVDEYASLNGSGWVQDMFVCGGDPEPEQNFRDGALEYVRNHYGNPAVVFILWIFVRPLVMSIIQDFIEALLFGSDDVSS